MATFVCKIVFDSNHPSVDDYAATFGREGDHLVTTDLDEVLHHRDEAKSNKRLARFHELSIDGSPVRLIDIDSVSPEGKITWKKPLENNSFARKEFGE